MKRLCHYKKYVLTVCLVLSAPLLFSYFEEKNDENLIFISYQNIPFILYSVPLTLIKYSKDIGLEKGTPFTTENEYINSLFIDYENKQVLVNTSSAISERQDNALLRVLDYEHNLVSKEMPYICPETYSIASNYVIMDDGIKIAYELIESSDAGLGDVEDVTLVGLELRDGSIGSLDWSAARNIVSNGQGGVMQEEDNVYLSIKNSRLRKYLRTRKKTINIDLNFEIPRELHQEDNCIVRLLIQNDNIIVVSIDTPKKNADGSGSEDILIYDKKKSIWHKKTIQGDRTSLKSFGEYISGIVIYSKEGEELEYEKIQDERSIEGISKVFHIDIPGILFVYDALSRRDYVFNTGERDSEVIFARDTDVYWRKRDKIYKAKLSHGTFIENKLIVKDELVKDAHWLVTQ